MFWLLIFNLLSLENNSSLIAKAFRINIRVSSKFIIYLDQSTVLSFVKIFPNALFPVTTEFSWRSLGAWRALTSFIAGITFDSPWSRRAHGAFRPQCPWRSLGALKPFTSWFPCVASVSTWSRGSLRAWWPRSACRPRGSRTSRHTWDSWRAKTGTITTRCVWWKLLSALNVKRKTALCVILIDWNVHLNDTFTVVVERFNLSNCLLISRFYSKKFFSHLILP